MLVTDPVTGKKQLVDDSSKPIKAAWYAVPAVMTFIGLMAWLVG